MTFAKAILCSYSWRFIRTIGAFSIIFNRICNKKIVYIKTERK